MRWMKCSFRQLLELPDGYLEVIEEIAKKEYEEAKARRRAAQRR